VPWTHEWWGDWAAEGLKTSGGRVPWTLWVVEGTRGERDRSGN